MTTTNLKVGQPTASNNREILTYSEDITDEGFSTWRKFVDCDLCAQVSGDATTFTAIIQRSDVNPAQVTAQPAPADADGFDGDLTTGIPPNIYTEPGVGWWRWNVVTLTGGTATVSFSGKS